MITYLVAYALVALGVMLVVTYLSAKEIGAPGDGPQPPCGDVGPAAGVFLGLVWPLLLAVAPLGILLWLAQRAGHRAHERGKHD